MKDAPERIWIDEATLPHDETRNGRWEAEKHYYGTEYVRADLLEAQAAQLQEALALLSDWDKMWRVGWTNMSCKEAMRILEETRALLAKSQ